LIAHLRGTLASKAATHIIVDVQGVGFALACSTQTLASLGEVGSPTELFSLMQVRDDSISLIGFASADERELFERLVGVNGVGGKMALAALSTYNTSALVQLIATGDVAGLSLIPGVGKKTAQRIVLELKGNLDKMVVGAAGEGSKDRQPVGTDEAVAALKSMGFSESEVALAINGYDGEALDTTAILAYALKRLGGTL
jgi:Holliday junction DNA helicase RuvA